MLNLLQVLVMATFSNNTVGKCSVKRHPAAGIGIYFVLEHKLSDFTGKVSLFEFVRSKQIQEPDITSNVSVDILRQ